jgi:two-component system, OmpR family, phosphate regulon sensor histidine kinase PhoR
MTPALRQEIFKATLRALAGALLGALFGHWQFGVILGLLLYLLMHLRYLTILRSWFESPKTVELPEPGGIWGEIYESLLTLQRRNRKRKKRLAAIVSEFQASTEALPDGAVVLGERGEILWFNTAARTLLGLRSPQDIGQRVPNLIRHPVFTAYFTTADYHSEVEAPSPINTALMLGYRVIPYGNGQRLLVVRDISDARRLEVMRRDFVANASHELRTPLTVLRGYLDMMLTDPEALSTWRGPISEMRNQAQRMESLINDLLKLARLEGDGPLARAEPVDAAAMIERIVDEARALSRGRHRIESDVQAGLGLLGRDSELQSIFSNLVSNAVHYTSDGGIVRVRWGETIDGAEFSVADTGIGISKADLPRLTERFYRVDVGRSRSSGGTGLGLSIVKHALERCEGRLKIDSEPGVGSTFSCHFPSHRVQRSLVTESVVSAN